MPSHSNIYSSLVVRRDEHGTRFAHTIARLATANPARWVQRITLPRVVVTTDLQRTLEFPPNRFFRHRELLSPNFILPLHVLPRLAREYCTLCKYGQGFIRVAKSSMPPILHSHVHRPTVPPPLHSLYIPSASMPPLTQFLFIPNLRTLHFTCWHIPPSVLQDVLYTHLPTIHALASDKRSLFTASRPSVPFPAPHLRLKGRPRPCSMFPPTFHRLQLGILHLPLERKILRSTIPKNQSKVPVQWEKHAMNSLSIAMSVARYLSATPRLHTICTGPDAKYTHLGWTAHLRVPGRLDKVPSGA